MAYFLLHFFCNSMFWKEGYKGMKGIKERKKKRAWDG
jgi:hypothetical protein